MKDLAYYKAEYPKLFENSMLSNPVGWDGILLDILHASERWKWLDKKLSRTVSNLDYITICQVKEKMGGLRVYYKFHTIPHDYAENDISTSVANTMNGIICYAEVLASKTCQICSESAKLVHKAYYVAVLCEDCDTAQ